MADPVRERLSTKTARMNRVRLTSHARFLTLIVIQFQKAVENVCQFDNTGEIASLVYQQRKSRSAVVRTQELNPQSLVIREHHASLLAKSRNTNTQLDRSAHAVGDKARMYTAPLHRLLRSLSVHIPYLLTHHLNQRYQKMHLVLAPAVPTTNQTVKAHSK